MFSFFPQSLLACGYSYFASHSVVCFAMAALDACEWLFTVGMTRRGFVPFTNIRNSVKLLCSLYGIPYAKTFPRCVGFMKESAGSFCENVQPVGLRPRTCVYVFLNRKPSL
eukprot:m.23707 g.23707  ORF g.23707 m.23707 type:complete len:111 (-) comp9020_c0_seq2:515-847(-)